MRTKKTLITTLTLSLLLCGSTCSEAKSLQFINSAALSQKQTQEKRAIGAEPFSETIVVRKESGAQNNRHVKKVIPTQSLKTVAHKEDNDGNKGKTQHVNEAVAGPSIRVFIKYSQQDFVKITPREPIKVILDTGKVLMEEPANRPIMIALKKGSLYVNNKKATNTVTIAPKDGKARQILLVDDANYRGSIVVTTALHTGRLGIINKVSLEEYLYGVVPEEAVPSWPRAALEAQAVAARTYAYHALVTKKGAIYDVENDTRSQVYKGVNSEYDSTTRAVDSTKGIILTYKGRPIDAVFHADGGGYTEDSQNVWGTEYPYLRGVSESYRKDKVRSTYMWTVKMTRTAIENKLKAASKDVGTLKEIKLSSLEKRPMSASDRGVSGRILQATIVGSKGSITIEGNKLMNILGLRSTCFDFYVNHEPVSDVDTEKHIKAYHTFKKGNEIVYIKGYGWGHGLGMSQWGAAEMAKQASLSDTEYYKKILTHYYNGVEVKKIY